MNVKIIKEWSNGLSSYMFYVYKDKILISSFRDQEEAHAFIDAVINTWVGIEPSKVVWERDY